MGSGDIRETMKQADQSQNFSSAEKVFLAAIEISSPRARESFIADACAADPDLLKQVRALLESHQAHQDTMSTVAAPSAPSSQDSKILAPGMTLADRYRVIGMIGRGGMGEVYRAEDLKLKQVAAIKLLPRELAGNERFLEALYNEVRQARRVSHRHVCRVHDIGEAEEGQTYLTMEFIEGENLQSLIRRMGRLPLSKALELGRQLCEGVQAGHREDVLHLDLKPANVMVDQRGEVRVTDFGLARFANEPSRQKHVGGTPGYMAPEQLLFGEVSKRCDIYAVGLILYEMIAGCPGIRVRGIEELRRFHFKEERIVLPSEIHSDVDADYNSIVMRCLERDPESRYESLSELLKDLDKCSQRAAISPSAHIASPACLLFTEIVGSVRLQLDLGAEAYTRFVSRHDEIIRDCLALAPGSEILNETSDGFLVRLPSPKDAVESALRLQHRLTGEVCEGKPMTLRIGLHMGAITELRERSSLNRRAVGMAINLASHVMQMGEAGQILLTRSIYEEGRQFVRSHPDADASAPDNLKVEWQSHGLFKVKGQDEAVELYEVGTVGVAPFKRPQGEESGDPLPASTADDPESAAADVVDTLKDSDVFISYAPIDNRPLSPGQSGWISQFHRNLATRMEQLSGERINVVQRPTSADDESAHLELLDQVPKMKAMVSVISPPYVKSRNCAKEVETFWRSATEEGNLRVEDRTRLLKVVKTPVLEGDMPAPLDTVLSDLLSFDFYSVDPQTGRLWEYDETFGVEARRLYYERVYDLAYDLCHVLRAFQKKTGDHGSAQDGRTIFLAETTRDLQGARDRMRRELQERGHVVLPDRPLPLNGPELESAVIDCLNRSQMAIHFVGSLYGLIPEEAEESIVALQNRVASAHVASSPTENAIPRFIWLPKDRTEPETRQRDFIQQLVEDPQEQLGAELIEETLDEFQEILIEELRPEEPVLPAAEPPEGRTRPRVYLICDAAGEEAVEALEDYLFDQGFEILTPHFDGDEAEICRYHRENLVRCDAALIYYGAVSKGWVETKLMDLAQARGFGREKPIAAKLVYVAAPFDRRKERFRTHDADVVRPENSETVALKPFVDLIQSQTQEVNP